MALGCRLIKESSDRSLVTAKECKACAEVVELIHIGSLVVDDIEDGSSTRRGRPALHVRYGLPLALNAGNWLYFWPFELLKELRWPRDKLLFVYEQCHRTLLKAHFGQALDLGGRVEALPPHQITEICLASMQLKTGALMGFAVSLGGLVGRAPKRVLAVLDDFGRDLGVALQMFDDLGNVIGRREPSKKYEDLMLHRPSWIWACAASNGAKHAFTQFTSAVRKLPDGAELEEWFAEHGLIARGRQLAREHLNSTFGKLEQRLNAERPKWSKQALEGLRELGEEIALAYG